MFIQGKHFHEMENPLACEIERLSKTFLIYRKMIRRDEIIRYV